MNRLTTILCFLGLSTLAACTSNSMGHRPQNTNPDERLEQLLEDYEHCKTAQCEGDQSNNVLIDQGRMANQLERLALEFPRHAPTQLANGLIALENHQPEKAESYCDAALFVQPVYPEAAILKAQLSIAANNLSAARRLLEAQVDYTPNHIMLRETYAAVLLALDQIGPAKAQLSAAEHLGAPAWRVAYNRGLIAEGEKNYAEATRQFQACLAGNPDYVPAQARLAGRNAEGGVQ